MRVSLLGSLPVAALLAGLCACAGPVKSAAARRGKPAAAGVHKPGAADRQERLAGRSALAGSQALSLAGTWDWVHRSDTDQGDLRIEQEEWHLDQAGARLSGYYDRQVVTLSTDQRPFRCNGALGFTKSTRVRITGEVQGERVLIREVAADTQQNPCDSGARTLLSYVGRLQGDSLVLQYAPGGAQYLTRRQAGPERASAPGAESPAAALPLGGVWEWELRTVDAEGDLRVEREEWHLSEVDGAINGSYQRTVERSRPGGTFPCNGSSAVSTATQYVVRGQRFGDRLTISEVDFRAQPGPCDNAQRRLDTYQGVLAPSGQELLLSWGSGSQLLKKKQ